MVAILAGMPFGFHAVSRYLPTVVNPFRTARAAVLFWAQSTQILSSLPPERGCSANMVDIPCAIVRQIAFSFMVIILKVHGLGIVIRTQSIIIIVTLVSASLS